MKLLITGADGLVGTALRRLAPDAIFITRKEADLTSEQDVMGIYGRHHPDYVIHAAAKVGGIGGNMAGHADYFYQNIIMNSHMIHYANLFDVKKMLVFSSVCVFPDGIEILREDLMHKGEPFTGNFAYAHAKRMVDIQIQAYRSQYGVKNFCSIIPGNIFGINDLYNLKHGHVLPSLMHKLYLAKRDNTPLRVWGDGESRREFIYADDLARYLLKILELDEIPPRIIISGEKEYSIREIVDKLCFIAEFNGEVIYETDKPNGQRSRPSDLSLLRSLIDLNPTSIDTALLSSYLWFESNYEKARK